MKRSFDLIQFFTIAIPLFVVVIVLYAVVSMLYTGYKYGRSARQTRLQKAAEQELALNKCNAILHERYSRYEGKYLQQIKVIHHYHLNRLGPVEFLKLLESSDSVLAGTYTLSKVGKYIKPVYL